MKLIIFVILLFSCFNFAYSNDGAAAIATGGIVFSKSEHISIEKEILTIGIEEIKVEYLFKNNFNENITTIIAFPLPDIICDPFENMNYPENFKAHVNDQKIELNKEIKAIVYSDIENYKSNQNISDLLQKHGIPLDCREIKEVSKNYDQLMNTEISIEYKKLMDLGLGCCDPKLDPWSIYHKTQIKYYWTQTFKAGQTLKIVHSYQPSFGMRNGYYENDEMRAPIENNIQQYRNFYIDQFKLDKNGKTFTIEDKYFIYLNYILMTANTWDGPIKEFILVLKSTGNLIVSNIDDPFENQNGNLVIKKENYIPAKDLLVFFFK